jgi:hypothetical protein
MNSAIRIFTFIISLFCFSLLHNNSGIVHGFKMNSAITKNYRHHSVEISIGEYNISPTKSSFVILSVIYV